MWAHFMLRDFNSGAHYSTDEGHSYVQPQQWAPKTLH